MLSPNGPIRSNAYSYEAVAREPARRRAGWRAGAGRVDAPSTLLYADRRIRFDFPDGDPA